MKKRCEWPGNDESMLEYHDAEWGVPVHDDRKHFEFLVLDAFQAGLSWAIILKKRENFRKAFDNFDPAKISRYREARIEKLLSDTGIIRNRLKIISTITNARSFLEIQKEFGSFDSFIRQFTGGRQRINKWKKLGEIPSRTPESDAMSRELKERGFKFVGSTICYSYMQAAGIVNDHVTTCFRYREVMEQAAIS